MVLGSSDDFASPCHAKPGPGAKYSPVGSPSTRRHYIRPLGIIPWRDRTACARPRPDPRDQCHLRRLCDGRQSRSWRSPSWGCRSTRFRLRWCARFSRAARRFARAPRHSGRGWPFDRCAGADLRARRRRDLSSAALARPSAVAAPRLPRFAGSRMMGRTQDPVFIGKVDRISVRENGAGAGVKAERAVRHPSDPSASPANPSI
jgi:hypothetical protein